MLFTPAQSLFAEAHSRFAHVNPFAKSSHDELYESVMQIDLGLADEEARSPLLEIPGRPGVPELIRRVHALLEMARRRLAGPTPPDVDAATLRLYSDLATSWLYYRYRADFQSAVEAGDAEQPVSFYQEYAAEHRRFFGFPLPFEAYVADPAHLFACYFQIRRAFHLIRQSVCGTSRPMGRLRAAIWHSIFSHDFRLFGQLLYDRMHDIATLIIGPTGTGKEVVARAIGLSRHIPFDPKRRRFTEHFGGAFHPINLSAMPRDLIESEMFGHCAGAFTGAAKDREGWFEKCGECHSVFLDEIGELEPAVQVKLLRVLQSREFYRVGETRTRHFKGKVIAATNRDLAAEMHDGAFREDLYFRLWSDVIHTPSLREQLDDRPEDLFYLVRLVAERVLGNQAISEYVERLTNQTFNWINRSPQLGLRYAWPGNFRELEQCVRSIMVRGGYVPPCLSDRAVRSPQEASAHAEAAMSAVDRFVAQVRAGELSFDDLLDHYCSFVFMQEGNVTRTARRLGKHRATIRSRVKSDLVEKLARDALPWTP
jgi:DNA-binding NtrC family response regulator